MDNNDQIDLAPLMAEEFLALQFEQSPPILAPLLPAGSLAMLYGPRGIGKSFAALAIALAVAGGGGFLKWRAPRPRRVLYIDGERTAGDFRQRLTVLAPVPKMLELLVGGLGTMDLPDLGSDAGRRAVSLPWPSTGRPELVVLDSLSSLVGGGRPTAKDWRRVRSWLLTLRRQGTAVLMVHHGTNRGGLRGADDQGDAFDLVMSLRRPDDYRPREGVRFDLHFEKASGPWGADLDPIEARLTTNVAEGDAAGKRRGAPGAAHWSWRLAAPSELHRVAALLKAGRNPHQIGRELGLSKSQSYRLRDRAVEVGLVKIQT